MSLGPVRKNVRIKILKRDGHKCKICGKTKKEVGRLTVDHIIPRAVGGTNRQKNLQAACFECNNLKANKVPNRFKKRIERFKKSLDRFDLRQDKSYAEKYGKP